tara:strand:+ start:459 stop:1268 length:810 start_codon:yes stop_codon:yes gene_type:complete
MNIIIYQHLGLGDMISNNALIRYLIKVNPKTKSFFILCKKMHFKTIKFMYRDLKKIRIVAISNDQKKEKKEVNRYLKNFKKDYELIKIGHEFYLPTNNLNPDKNNPWHCTINFYKQFGLPFDYKYKNSFWKRDYKNEKKLFKKLVKNSRNYIFVHDDIKRGLVINTEKFSKNLKIIRNDEKNFIFDYGLIIEKASEIHLIESSFRQLCEVLNLKTKKLFLYKDERPDYSMSLYNKHNNKLIGTSKKWNEKTINRKKKSSNKFLRFFKKK